jgi:16S rRNA G527 N7-methylase RsmG
MMKKIIQSKLPKNLSLWQKTMNWQPDEGHLLEFKSFYDLILEANEQMNLTRIVDGKDFWGKAFMGFFARGCPIFTGRFDRH